MTQTQSKNNGVSLVDLQRTAGSFRQEVDEALNAARQDFQRLRVDQKGPANTLMALIDLSARVSCEMTIVMTAKQAEKSDETITMMRDILQNMREVCQEHKASVEKAARIKRQSRVPVAMLTFASTFIGSLLLAGLQMPGTVSLAPNAVLATLNAISVGSLMPVMLAGLVMALVVWRTAAANTDR